jgi:hypothetical protein
LVKKEDRKGSRDRRREENFASYKYILTREKRAI